MPVAGLATRTLQGNGEIGYIAQPQAAPAHALLDRIVAILWRLTHPKP